MERPAHGPAERTLRNVQRVGDHQHQILGRGAGRLEAAEVQLEVGGRPHNSDDRGVVHAVHCDGEGAGTVGQAGTGQRPLTANIAAQRLGENGPRPGDGGRAGHSVPVLNHEPIPTGLVHPGAGVRRGDPFVVLDGRFHVRRGGNQRAPRTNRLRRRMHVVGDDLTGTARSPGLRDGPHPVDERLYKRIRQRGRVQLPCEGLTGGVGNAVGGHDRTDDLELRGQLVAQVHRPTDVGRVLAGESHLVGEDFTAGHDIWPILVDRQRGGLSAAIIVHQAVRRAGERLLTTNILIQGQEGDVSIPVGADRRGLGKDIEGENDRATLAAIWDGAAGHTAGIAKHTGGRRVHPIRAQRAGHDAPEPVVLESRIQAEVTGRPTGVGDGDLHSAGHRVAVRTGDRRRDLQMNVRHLGVEEDTGRGFNRIGDGGVSFQVAAWPICLGRVDQITRLHQPNHGKCLHLVHVQHRDRRRGVQRPPDQRNATPPYVLDHRVVQHPQPGILHLDRPGNRLTEVRRPQVLERRFLPDHQIATPGGDVDGAGIQFRGGCWRRVGVVAHTDLHPLSRSSVTGRPQPKTECDGPARPQVVGRHRRPGDRAGHSRDVDGDTAG